MRCVLSSDELACIFPNLPQVYELHGQSLCVYACFSVLPICIQAMWISSPDKVASHKRGSPFGWLCFVNVICLNGFSWCMVEKQCFSIAFEWQSVSLMLMLNVDIVFWSMLLQCCCVTASLCEAMKKRRESPIVQGIGDIMLARVSLTNHVIPSSLSLSIFVLLPPPPNLRQWDGLCCIVNRVNLK